MTRIDAKVFFNAATPGFTVGLLRASQALGATQLVGAAAVIFIVLQALTRLGEGICRLTNKNFYEFQNRYSLQVMPCAAVVSPFVSLRALQALGMPIVMPAIVRTAGSIGIAAFALLLLQLYKDRPVSPNTQTRAEPERPPQPPAPAKPVRDAAQTKKFEDFKASVLFACQNPTISPASQPADVSTKIVLGQPVPIIDFVGNTSYLSNDNIDARQRSYIEALQSGAETWQVKNMDLNLMKGTFKDLWDLENTGKLFYYDPPIPVALPMKKGSFSFPLQALVNFFDTNYLKPYKDKIYKPLINEIFNLIVGSNSLPPPVAEMEWNGNPLTMKPTKIFFSNDTINGSKGMKIRQEMDLKTCEDDILMRFAIEARFILAGIENIDPGGAYRGIYKAKALQNCQLEVRYIF
jgi:hypothetical protein